jgi:hypothetical protein
VAPCRACQVQSGKRQALQHVVSATEPSAAAALREPFARSTTLTEGPSLERLNEV